MAPTVQNKTTYKEHIQLNLDKLKKQQIKQVKVDLTQVVLQDVGSWDGRREEAVRSRARPPSRAERVGGALNALPFQCA